MLCCCIKVLKLKVVEIVQCLSLEMIKTSVYACQTRNWNTFCFRFLTANNTNSDILFATKFILIQMTATVTLLLLLLPKVTDFKVCLFACFYPDFWIRLPSFLSPVKPSINTKQIKPSTWAPATCPNSSVVAWKRGVFTVVSSDYCACAPCPDT